MRLTPRQLDVLRGLLNGLRDREIAESLGISIYTVKAHKRFVFEYLGITKKAQLVPLMVAAGTVAEPAKKAKGATA